MQPTVNSQPMVQDPSPLPQEMGTPSLRSRWDRILIAILVASFLIRMGFAVGIHQMFQEAIPAHVWTGTDEATYYTHGLDSAEILKTHGWHAFVTSPPRPEHLNWAHFKYTGLVLYVFGDHPFLLRLLSILFSVAGVFLFCRSIGRCLPNRRSYLFYAGVVALLPSPMFWSALAIKEGIVRFLLGLCCWVMCKSWAQPRPWIGLALIALTSLILGSIRIWAGLACFGIFAAWLLLFHPGRPAIRILVPVAVAIAAVLVMIPNVQMLFGYHLIESNSALQMKMYAPTLHLVDNLTILDGVTYPASLKPLVAWFLPLPWLSDRSPLMLMAGFENILYILLGLAALRGAWRKLSALEWCWASLAILILAVTLMFGGNLGTIYRTKAMALPFLAYFAVQFLSPWLNKIPKLNWGASKR